MSRASEKEDAYLNLMQRYERTRGKERGEEQQQQQQQKKKQLCYFNVVIRTTTTEKKNNTANLCRHVHVAKEGISIP